MGDNNGAAVEERQEDAAELSVEEVARNVARELHGEVDASVARRMRELGLEMPRTGESVITQIANQVAERLEDQGIADAHGRISRPPTRGSTAIRNGLAVGAGLDGEFETFGRFLRAVYDSRGAAPDSRLAVLQEGAGSTGGALVPEEYRAQLLRQSLQMAQVRPRAFVIPMESNSLRVPAVSDTSHASNVFGGVAANWTEEGGTITASEPTFEQIGLVAKKLAFYTSAGNELVTDSAISLEAILLQLFGEAVRWFEEKAFITGGGAGEPLGFLNSPAVIEVAKESGQNADTIVWANIVKMYARMFPASLGRAVWMVSPDVFPQLAQMSLSVGTGGSAIWINNGAGGPPSSMLGIPILVNEFMSVLGDAGDIALVDLSYYLIGDRQALTVASSPHPRFQNDETVWRGIERLDGKPWIRSAITPANGGPTLSPIVTLAARA